MQPIIRLISDFYSAASNINSPYRALIFAPFWAFVEAITRCRCHLGVISALVFPAQHFSRGNTNILWALNLNFLIQSSIGKATNAPTFPKACYFDFVRDFTSKHDVHEVLPLIFFDYDVFLLFPKRSTCKSTNTNNGVFWSIEGNNQFFTNAFTTH